MTKSKRKKHAAPALTLIVENSAWRDRKDVLALLRRAAKLALGAPSLLPEEPVSRAATVLLSNDKRLRDLNHTFRGKNRPTNVLSFPADDPAYLGDVALGLETVAKEARAQNKTLAAHAAHLAIHGVLHLLGYDHAEDAEAKAMESLEIQLLAKLGIGNPYAPVPYTAKGKAA